MRMFLASVCLLAACAQPKSPVSDDFQGLDAKSDSFSYRMTIVGSLDYGQTSASTKYTHTPRYRAFKFAGNQGDLVDVWVRSTDGGDAVAWLLDNSFHVVASNDDADDTTFDAHISTTLPANASATHYIVFRDYYTDPAHFTVTLAGGAATPACQIDDDCAGFHAGTSETAVPECNFATNHCEMIEPTAIHCGGFIAHTHSCPANFECHYVGVPDVGGTCIAAP
jgi:hypothetical protein